MKTKIDKNRRQLLVWSAPVIAAVTLPAHASTSECSVPPIVNVAVAPKCAGNPPIGTAVLEIFAPSTIEVELKGIEVTTNDPVSTLDTLQTFPTTITGAISETVIWNGPASDALTCLPLAQISMTLEFCCEGGLIEFETYDITALLIASIP